MVELVAGKNRDDDFAHANHVAIHFARFARGAGDGNVEREAHLWRPGDGFELL